MQDYILKDDLNDFVEEILKDEIASLKKEILEEAKKGDDSVLDKLEAARHSLLQKIGTQEEITSTLSRAVNRDSKRIIDVQVRLAKIDENIDLLSVPKQPSFDQSNSV